MATTAHRVTTPSTSNTTSYVSGSFTPVAGELLLVFVMAGATLAAGSVTGSTGLTFSKVAEALVAGSTDKMYVFVANAQATAVSQTVTFDCTGDAADGTVILVGAVGGITRTGLSAIRQFITADNQAAGTPSLTFPAAVLTGNPTWGFVGNANNPANLTAPTGHTTFANSGYSTPTTGGVYCARLSGFTGPTLTWASASATAFGAIAIEVDTSVAAIDLVINDLSQAQTLESFAFTQEHVLAVDNLSQGETLEAFAFTQVHELVIAGMSQAQTLDNLTIDSAIALVIANLSQAQTLESFAFTQMHELSIAALSQAQTLDGFAFTQVHELVIAALSQAQTLDGFAFTQLHQLTINALSQAQTLDSLTVTLSAIDLIVANLTQAQTLSNIVVTVGGGPLLRPTIDVVAVALLRVLTGVPATRVDTTLPKDVTVWSDGFIQAVGISEQSGMYVPLHSSLISVSCWATNPGSGKPPWGKANQLAETIKVECLEHNNFPIALDLSSFGNYAPARVHSAYVTNEPHRILSDEGSYARYDSDLQVHWTPL